ncbi:MAG: hypothetical protein ABFR75_07310 [Acidobacteriota bacterium]
MKSTTIPFKIQPEEPSGILENIIREHLYPEDKFPSRIFPDLIPILFSLFKKETGYQDKVNLNFQNGDPEYLKKQIVSLLNLKALVKNHPDIVVLLYRNLISIYISKKHFNKNEIEDIVQEIITRILDKNIHKIRETFDFTDTQNPTFSSYFLVTIRNIYIDIIREGKNLYEKENLEKDFEKAESANSGQMMNSLIIEEEFLKLEALIKLYHRISSRMILILKIKSKADISEKDILSCFPDCSRKDIEFFKNDFKHYREKIIFKKITPLFNKYESKKNRPDSLRKWISVKVDEIKNHMNNTHNNSPYNNSNISDLFIMYFRWFGERER